MASAVSLCGHLRSRSGKLFVHNPDGTFEIRAAQHVQSKLLPLAGEGASVMVGGIMRTWKNGSYINLQTFRLVESPHQMEANDHLETILQISLSRSRLAAN